MQRSTTTAADGATNIMTSSRRDPLLVYRDYRANSAQANLQSHPCFQSSLFNDKDRAVGSFKAWKERLESEKPSLLQLQSVNDVGGINAGGFGRKHLNKDYQLENVIWTQSVKQPRRLTLNNAECITDWEVTLLKRQKRYAAAAVGDLKGKVS
jgi:hypothetical protein